MIDPAAISLPIDASMSPWLQGAIIILATYVLEDPTTIVTGLLIREGTVDPVVGVASLLIGIFTGDIGLYLLGATLGKRVLSWRPIARRLPSGGVDSLGAFVDRHGWSAILASRFLPGTRLPLYVAAGALGRSPLRFALWTFIAVALWAPAMVAVVVALGAAGLPAIRAGLRNDLVALAMLAVIMLLLMRLLGALADRQRRRRLAVRIQRLWRWEFWPTWLFYMPAIPWILWLSIRHRGFHSITAANPAIPHGGLVDESKYDILRLLPAEWTARSVRIAEGSIAERTSTFDAALAERGWSLPIVLKPDVGERGNAVRIIRDRDQAIRYLSLVRKPVIVQEFHPGPHEAGIFFMRMPEERDGRIFSVTDKIFSFVEGDGRSTVKELIWAHPRYRMQSETFLRRLGERAQVVPSNGERIALAHAGNHCQGTLFQDGAHLLTPQLEDRINAIMREVDGIHFGRLDVRYASVEALRAGEGFSIIELNGISSESTNMYDPRRSLLWAYRILFRQWSMLFRIASACRNRGVRPSTPGSLLRLLLGHYTDGQRVELVSD